MTKILAIDNDHTILALIEALLTKSGYTTDTASNGRDGLEKARNTTPNAIVLDRQMPEMDGNQVLIELKADEALSNIPVIMLTGDNRINDISACLDMGAADYIIKPFDKEDFLARLDKVLRS